MRIFYEDLVRGYLDSLHSKLRNFSVEQEFLATWVHDEDDHVSISEIFASAQSAGCRDLTVVVGAKTSARLDEARLRSMLAPLGAATLSRASEGGWELTVALSEKVAPLTGKGAVKAAAPPPRTAAPPAAPRAAAPARKAGPIHPAYSAAVARLCSSARFEGPAPAAPAGGLLVESSEGGASLALAVAPDGVVAAASHSGATGDLRGLLEGLCALLPGRPFQEGRDHAVIRLEASLRDRALASPARGVITPRTADPAFAVPERLVRAAYREWAKKTAAKPGWNFWDDKPAAAWLALSAPERMSRAEAAVAEACRALGASAGVEVLELLNDCRIVLAATPETIKSEFALIMMRLERRVKAKLDPRIEVQLESLEDRNRRAERTQRSDRQL